MYEERRYWDTDEDWQQAYNAFAALEIAMAGNCIAELIESNNRIYRLLDTTLNGTEYTADSATPPVITPGIPAVPTNEIGEAPGLRRQLLAAQGVINAGWFGIGGQPATLADVVAALRVGTGEQANNILGTLDELQAASSVANIFGTVSDLFTDVVETGAEGAVLATLIAATMGNAAMMGAQAAQLDTLVARLDSLIAALGGAEGDTIHNAVDRVNDRTGSVQDAVTALDGNLAAQLTDILAAMPPPGTPINELVDDVEQLLTDIKGAVQ